MIHQMKCHDQNYHRGCNVFAVIEFVCLIKSLTFEALDRGSYARRNFKNNFKYGNPCGIFGERKVILARPSHISRPFFLMLYTVTFMTDSKPFKKSSSNTQVSIRITPMLGI